jgi:predicted Zn-dependent protease
MKKSILFILAVIAVALPSSVSAYNYPNQKWGVNTVGWDLSGLGVPAWKTSARDAMENWNNTRSKFSMIEYPGSHNTMAYYWDQSDTVGYTKRYLQYGLWGNIYKSIIRINNYYRFNPPYSTGSWKDLRTLFRHELGHTLALDHVTNLPTAVMYPILPYNSVVNLSSDEIAGIRAIYGTR